MWPRCSREGYSPALEYLLALLLVDLSQNQVTERGMFGFGLREPYFMRIRRLHLPHLHHDEIIGPDLELHDFFALRHAHAR